MTPPNNPQLAQQVVDFLNEVLKLSPEALSALVEYRVPCTQALADHPTVQVAECSGSPGTYEVGLLGILNGLCGCRSTGGGYIGASVDTDIKPQQVEYFKLLKDTEVTP